MTSCNCNALLTAFDFTQLQCQKLAKNKQFVVTENISTAKQIVI